MGSYVLGFQEIDQMQVAIVGGKGAHLGELSRIEGIRVPAGFCVTTDASRQIMAEAPSIDERHPRHGLHGPQLDSSVRRHRGPGDGGRGPGTCHTPDPRWGTDPREWNGRVRRDPTLAGP